MAGQARHSRGQPPKVQVRQTMTGRTVAVSIHCKFQFVGNGSHRQECDQKDPAPPWGRNRSTKKNQVAVPESRCQRITRAIGMTRNP